MKQQNLTICYKPAKWISEYESFKLIKAIASILKGTVIDWGHNDQNNQDYVVVSGSPYDVAEAQSIVTHCIECCKSMQ